MKAKAVPTVLPQRTEPWAKFQWALQFSINSTCLGESGSAIYFSLVNDFDDHLLEIEESYTIDFGSGDTIHMFNTSSYVEGLDFPGLNSPSDSVWMDTNESCKLLDGQKFFVGCHHLYHLWLQECHNLSFSI